MVLAFLLVGILAGSSTPKGDEWNSLESGLDMRWLTTSRASTPGDARIAVVRIDPSEWELHLIARNQSSDSTSKTARQWANDHDLTVAINAGMFGTDHETHLGYMESKGHIGSRSVNAYQSVAAFDPRDPKLPAFRMFDLDESGVSVPQIALDYSSLVQNLRLVKKPGENRWGTQAKKWSEAALGEDSHGRILFVFSRSPFSMRDFNEELLSAGIDLVALQHLEGGPEAQLYLKAGETEIELVGSFETSFLENDGNLAAWPIPNVLGIRRIAKRPAVEPQK